MAPALICASVEVALNRTLRLDAVVLADLGKLRGAVLALTVEVFDWDFFIEVLEDGVRVAPTAPTAAVVHLRGTPLALGRIAAHYLGEHPGLPAGMQVEGDLEVLSRFIRLLVRVGLTPEELVAKALGNGPAQRLVGGLRGLLGFGLKSGKTVVSNTAEYLREERYALARKVDAEDWADAVDSLRDATERLEARIARLERVPAPIATEQKA